MIPRFLVPPGSRPPVREEASTRRRPTNLDERTLIPAMMPLAPLQERSNIPASLPLDAIAARVVVPRDVQPEAYAPREESTLPAQPSEMDERIAVPVNAAPPLIFAAPEKLPLDMVEADVFMTGEVNLLASEDKKTASAAGDLVTRVSSVLIHILIVMFLIFEPKIFPPHLSAEQQEIQRRQISILVPPGALEDLKPSPRPRVPPAPPVKVDPRVLREIAPPEPPPAPKIEQPAKELPSAPAPQPSASHPQPQTDAPPVKLDEPKPAPKLETPETLKPQRGLILPKGSERYSLQDSMRAAQKMSAPTAIGGGGQLPGSGIPSQGGQGSAFGALTMLTPTEGVDFSNYLQRVYVTVKQNWYAVMPESVRLGDKGMVVLRFKIMKNGSVPADDPLRMRGSGKEPLDRAAVSSIRASNPFEPLPRAFSGPYIELQFTYLYNLPLEAASAP
jgi:hypothetical protein